jgi:hypothetical protein
MSIRLCLNIITLFIITTIVFKISKFSCQQILISPSQRPTLSNSFIVLDFCSVTYSKSFNMSSNGSSNKQIIGNGHSQSNGQSSGPWTYLCGKCPMEFSQKSSRDNHYERCNRPENGATQSSRCVHDSTSFPTGADEG